MSDKCDKWDFSHAPVVSTGTSVYDVKPEEESYKRGYRDGFKDGMEAATKLPPQPSSSYQCIVCGIIWSGGANRYCARLDCPSRW